LKEEDKSKEQLIEENRLLRGQIKALKQANKMQGILADLVENLPNGIIVTDLDSRIIYVNKAIEKLTGYQHRELIGQFPVIFNAEINADEIQQQIVNCMQRNKNWCGEILQQRKKGSKYKAELEMFPVQQKDGAIIAWASIQRDIEALRESEERYRKLVELSPDAIAVYSEGKIILINNMGAKLYGVASPQELIGRQAMDFVHPDFHQLVKKRVQQMLISGETAALAEEKFIVSDGSIIDVEVAAAPLYFKGKPAVQVVVRDITWRKQAEKALETERQRLFSLLDGLPALLYLQTPNYRVCFANRYFRELFGEPGDKLCYSIIEGRSVPCENCPALYVMEKQNPCVCERTACNGRTFQVSYNPYYDVDGTPMVLVSGIDITERKKAEETLRVSEERFAKAFHSNPAAMAITTLDGYYIDVNKSFINVTGFNRVELLGRSSVKLGIWFDVDERTRYGKEILSNGAIYDVEFKFRKKAGEVRTGLLSVELIDISGERCFLSLFSDITESKQMQAALRRAQRDKEIILESISELVVYHDPNMIIKWANKSAGKSGGMTAAQLVGLHCYEVWYHREDPCPGCPVKKSLASGKFEERETIGPDGSIWLVKAYPVIEKDAIVGIVEVARDVTERRQVQIEMARFERLNLIGQMAAGIGHEVRNPMTTVHGFLQLLKGKEKCNDYIGYFDLMLEELDRANSIITQFLSLAKKKPEKKQMHNLNSILQTISPLIQADAYSLDKQLILQLNSIPDLILDDKEIRQLIFNLARNGLEAMQPGGSLTIKTYVEGQEVVLAFQDQGTGIEPEVFSKLGTPFFTTKDNGTGLGLAVCYSIVARHNARMNAESGPYGTTFFVQFQLGFPS